MYRLIFLPLTALLILSTAHATKTYQWVDEKGVTHFSTHQPPGKHSDQTRLKGGSLAQPRPGSGSRETAKINAIDLQNRGWQGCASSLCELVGQIDPDCHTSFCSRAKRYSDNCTSAACLTKKVAFEKEMRDRLATQNELRQHQAINANAVPTAPVTQSQD